MVIFVLCYGVACLCSLTLVYVFTSYLRSDNWVAALWEIAALLSMCFLCIVPNRQFSFSHLDLSGNIFLIVPFPDHCLFFFFSLTIMSIVFVSRTNVYVYVEGMYRHSNEDIRH